MSVPSIKTINERIARDVDPDLKLVNDGFGYQFELKRGDFTAGVPVRRHRIKGTTLSQWLEMAQQFANQFRNQKELVPDTKKYQVKYGYYVNALHYFSTDDRDKALEYYQTAKENYAIAEVYIRGDVFDGNLFAVAQ